MYVYVPDTFEKCIEPSSAENPGVLLIDKILHYNDFHRTFLIKENQWII